MENISTQDGDINIILSAAFEEFSRGNLDEGLERLEEALGRDFDNPEVVASLKCANYWRDRFSSLKDRTNGFEKAEYLLNQWKGFPAFVLRAGSASERCVAALKQLVFRNGLSYYEELIEGPPSGGKDADILLRIGKCYKALGAYDKALGYLDAANQIKKEQAEILAELADCYALINEMHISKAFFREAFFLNPQAIDFDNLESVMIRRLADKLREMGYEYPELVEWIPVYGVLFGVFTIKRELRSIEYGKLRQSIYSMEVELRENPKKKAEILPRLFNRYFWLIDHYLVTKENREKIDEVLLKIKELDPALYEQYTK